MNESEKPAWASATASEYINDNFKPSERIAVLVLNRSLRETTQRITTAQKAASPNSRHGSATRTRTGLTSMLA